MTALPPATDWSTAASLATAAGTLILAVATFSAVRSANQSARVAERALMAGLRPVLTAARGSDPEQKIRFRDDHWVKVPGGRAAVETGDGVVYLAMALRNVGAGLAVLHAWHIDPDQDPSGPHAEPEVFRRLGRDILVPAGDTGFWQGAIRDVEDPLYAPLSSLCRQARPVVIDLLYGDHEGGQRTITRFFIERPPEAAENQWLVTVSRHWNLDRPDPR